VTRQLFPVLFELLLLQQQVLVPLLVLGQLGDVVLLHLLVLPVLLGQDGPVRLRGGRGGREEGGGGVVELVVVVLAEFEVVLMLEVVVVFFQILLLLRALRKGDGRCLMVLVRLVDLVILSDEVVEGELSQEGSTSKFQLCCSRMLAAREGSWMLERSHRRRICSIC
jgi:hypothetical protein